MDELKNNLQLELAANVIIDKCAHDDTLIFKDSWCTQKRVIRFTTPFFRDLFSVSESERGAWQTGDYVMYECHNKADEFVVNCVMNLRAGKKDVVQAGMRIYKALMLPVAEKDKDAILKTWNLTSVIIDANKLFDEFDFFTQVLLPEFEKDLSVRLERSVPEVFIEGEAEKYTASRYERNKKAREACLAAHGTACAVCGLDFSKEYGPEFAGKIEVHHIVPISQIGKEYVVDPIRDLVPVCPNCHTALHSKKGGVYTVEELKRMMNK